jgi:hypothetical protein
MKDGACSSARQQHASLADSSISATTSRMTANTLASPLLLSIKAVARPSESCEIQGLMGEPSKFELPHVCTAKSRTCKLRNSPIGIIVREQGATDAEKMGASPYMFAGTVDHRRFSGRELSLGRGAGATRAGATRAGATRAGATRAGATRAGATRAGSRNPANSPQPEHATAQNVLLDEYSLPYPLRGVLHRIWKHETCRLPAARLLQAVKVLAPLAFAANIRV